VSWKCLFVPPKWSLWGFSPRNREQYQRHPERCSSRAISRRMTHWSYTVLEMWPPCVADADMFLPCGFYLFSSPNLSGRRLDVYHTLDTWCGLTANLECMSQMCRTRLAGYTGRKKSPSEHHRTTLSGCISATKARIDNWKKNLLRSNISSTCPHNMANFGFLIMVALCNRADHYIFILFLLFFLA